MNDDKSSLGHVFYVLDLVHEKLALRNKYQESYEHY